MKRFLVLSAMLAQLSATPALAALGDNWVGLHFGASIPAGTFHLSANSGFEGGLTATQMVSEHLGVGVELAYHEWDCSGRFARAVGAVGTFSALQVTGHVLHQAQTRGRVRPFAKGGFGIYWMRTMLDSVFGPSGDIRDTRPELGGNVGAGVNLGHTIGIAGTYHLVHSGGPATQFFTVSMNLGWGVE